MFVLSVNLLRVRFCTFLLYLQLFPGLIHDHSQPDSREQQNYTADRQSHPRSCVRKALGRKARSAHWRVSLRTRPETVAFHPVTSLGTLSNTVLAKNIVRAGTLGDTFGPIVCLNYVLISATRCAYFNIVFPVILVGALRHKQFLIIWCHYDKICPVWNILDANTIVLVLVVGTSAVAAIIVKYLAIFAQFNALSRRGRFLVVHVRIAP